MYLKELRTASALEHLRRAGNELWNAGKEFNKAKLPSVNGVVHCGSQMIWPSGFHPGLHKRRPWTALQAPDTQAIVPTNSVAPGSSLL